MVLRMSSNLDGSETIIGRAREPMKRVERFDCEWILASWSSGSYLASGSGGPGSLPLGPG